MCSSMRVFCAFIGIAYLVRGSSDPFHERRTAHPGRLGEVVGGSLNASDHVGVDTVGDGLVGVVDADGDDVDRAVLLHELRRGSRRKA
jgi:hypothetical protein